MCRWHQMKGRKIMTGFICSKETLKMKTFQVNDGKILIPMNCTFMLYRVSMLRNDSGGLDKRWMPETTDLRRNLLLNSLYSICLFYHWLKLIFRRKVDFTKLATILPSSIIFHSVVSHPKCFFATFQMVWWCGYRSVELAMLTPLCYSRVVHWRLVQKWAKRWGVCRAKTSVDAVFFVPGCKHVYFCCKVGHFSMGVNGDWLAFASLQWSFEELQFLTTHPCHSGQKN